MTDSPQICYAGRDSRYDVCAVSPPLSPHSRTTHLVNTVQKRVSKGENRFHSKTKKVLNFGVIQKQENWSLCQTYCKNSSRKYRGPLRYCPQTEKLLYINHLHVAYISFSKTNKFKCMPCTFLQTCTIDANVYQVAFKFIPGRFKVQ